jgi:hypothetical protein
MRVKPAWFRHDLLTLFDLLQQKKIKPLIAQRLPLCQARHAHELLGSGGVIGKIVLMPNGQQKSYQFVRLIMLPCQYRSLPTNTVTYSRTLGSPRS